MEQKVAIIALSSGLGEMFAHIVELAKQNYLTYYLRKCIVYPTAKMSVTEVLNNPKVRAADLNNAFLDKEVALIHSLIGGDDSIRILDYINLDIANKPVIGFSDATMYLSWLALHNKQAFYGPAILAGMAQAHNFGSAFITHFNDVLFTNDDVEYPIYDYYVNGYDDWNNPHNQGELLAKFKTTGPIILHGSGIISGQLWGGCLDTLEQMKQTKYYPKLNFFTNKVLFFETSENKPSPELVRRWLYNYCIQGIFTKCNAIMFGIFKDYSDEEKQRIYQYIKEVVIDEYKYDFPIIVNCPIGHTDPNWILPYNEIMEINLDKCTFKLVRN